MKTNENNYFSDISSEENFLSIEQMQELERLGIDCSNASCMWTCTQDENYNPIKWLSCFRDEDKESIETLRKAYPHTCKEGNIYYCFTLADILNLLPYQIELPSHRTAALEIRPIVLDKNLWEIKLVDDETIIHSEQGKLITAAFEMVKWTKENKF